MFDKIKFKEILSKIFNNYNSITEFANISEVSRTYLSQYVNLALDKAPTPKVLKKIADNSKGITTYEELMEVCGYLENPLRNDISDKNFTDFILSASELSENENKVLKELIENVRDYGILEKDEIERKLHYKIYNKDLSTNEKNRILNVFNKFKMLVIELIKNNVTHEQCQKSIKIPVLGSIPAGIPIQLIQDIIDYEDISEEMLKGGKEYFALKVKGTSMWPKYLDGDTIIVLKQNDCESGQDAIVMVNGDDGTFKRVIKKDTGITLEPINQQEYNSVSYSNEDIEKLPIKILGVVKEIRRKI